MIRLLIFSLVRFFISVIVIYFVLTLVKRMLRSFKGSSPSAQPETPAKPKEHYKDVQDAKFIELPIKQEGNKAEADT
jgi:hypothetical protein